MPTCKVPESIPKPDYAQDGMPYSEVQSRQQNTGADKSSYLMASHCFTLSSRQSATCFCHASCSGHGCTISMALALSMHFMTQSMCADHTASIRFCLLHQMECADNMKCMHCAVPIRNAKDIAGMRAACKLARQILDKAHAAVKPGVTTDEIDQVVKYCFLHLDTS